MRIAYYLNQFFAGVGAEEKAGMPLESREGAVGPGKLFDQLIGGDAKVVLTLVCGDNYAVENQEQMIAAAVEKIRLADADVLIAGPCFQAGRYGMAAGALCSAVQSQLNIPVLAAMSEENPGTDLYREMMYIVDSGVNAANMREAVRKMADLARKRTAQRRQLFFSRLYPRSICRANGRTAAGRHGSGEGKRRAVRIGNGADDVFARAYATGGEGPYAGEIAVDHGRRAGSERQPR